MTMKKNNSFKELEDVIKSSNTVYLFPHISIDADALGSSVALCLALRGLGKEAYILMEDQISEYISFLDKGYCTMDSSIIPNPDLCICIDNNSPDSRFPKRKEVFFSGKNTMCIDHHITTETFADYNYIDSSRGATAEIIYLFLKSMNVQFTTEMAEAIYSGIITDTGNFQYSNTTKLTHEIAVDLMDMGLDHTKISTLLYENNSFEKIKTISCIISEMKTYGNGRFAIAKASHELFSQVKIPTNEIEGISEALRGIKGVEIGIFLKEVNKGVVKVSMRSKSYANVAQLCIGYGGGGHKRAAGCTINLSLEEVEALIIKDVTEYLSGLGDQAQ